jgi:small subunit ribosomal protein S6
MFDTGGYENIRSLPEKANRPQGGVTMRKYEIMFIVNASLDDAARQALIANMNEIITNNGGVVGEVTEWGMREFAYEINHMTKGYYVVSNFEADQAGVKELDRLNRINGNIVRYLIINKEEE